MRRALPTSLGLLAGLAFGIAAARAEPFKCPHVGGDFTFGQEANINSLDQMTSGTISTRNIAMNIFESLMTRDENFSPILELADAMTESPDHLTYTFKLRQGVRFHNGKEMTSADVVASFDRYTRIGLYRSTLGNVERWDAPDKDTFVITLKKVQPTFLEILSSFSAPIVIIPAEEKDDPPMQLKSIGTGPWQLVESIPGGYVKLKRYDGYQPNTNFEQKTGFGGYKQACFNTVTFRIVTEPQARVAGLKTGELQGVEDLPTKSLPDLKADPHITIMPLQNWWIQIAQPNTSVPPTDNLMFRKAVQAVLDMDEIMDAASDGNYRLNVGFQYPNQAVLLRRRQGDLQHQGSRAGEEVPGAIRLQGRAGRAADRQGLPGDVQLGAGDAAADAGHRHQCAVEGGGLADLGANGAAFRHRLEPVLHRLGHAAGARCARHHAVLR